MTPKPILTMYFEAIYLFFLHFNINGFTTNANSRILLNVTWNTFKIYSTMYLQNVSHHINAARSINMHTHKQKLSIFLIHQDYRSIGAKPILLNLD